jgi:hypothetical protein
MVPNIQNYNYVWTNNAHNNKINIYLLTYHNNKCPMFKKKKTFLPTPQLVNAKNKKNIFTYLHRLVKQAKWPKLHRWAKPSR